MSYSTKYRCCLLSIRTITQRSYRAFRGRRNKKEKKEKTSFSFFLPQIYQSDLCLFSASRSTAWDDNVCLFLVGQVRADGYLLRYEREEKRREERESNAHCFLVLSGFLSILPVLSSWLVWVPACIVLYLQGKFTDALIVGGTKKIGRAEGVHSLSTFCFQLCIS
jgi:hypothetical protein